MPHDAARQRGVRRNDDRLNGINNGDARQLPDAVGRKVGFGEDRHHPGDRARSFQIQPGDARERIRRANDMGVQRVRHMVVGDISPAPGEKAKILQPAQGLTLITLTQPLTFFPKWWDAPVVRTCLYIKSASRKKMADAKALKSAKPT